ncbi:MAG: DMT family transporter [Pseudorhodobacter sp.]|nr:DMT family transporter [Pseudorhodobacter sp.]
MDKTPEQTLAASAYVLGFALIIGFTDNFVRLMAEETGLWQFHAIRSVMVLILVLAAGRIWGFALRPRNWLRVAARSALHGTALLIYFGALGFMPVAQVAAGLFTAPIFVLLIAWLWQGQPIGPVRIVAVGLGFAGVLLVLGPEAMRGASLAALLPILAGFLYAVGNVATREWCAGESAATLALGFFVALGVMGFAGLAVLTIWPTEAAPGAAGFIQRGWVTPSALFLGVTLLQAVGSLVGVSLLVRAYQIAEASRVSVFEYLNLPAAAMWGWLLWSEVLPPLALLGMALIAGAGALIALRARQSTEQSPTA